MRAYTCMNVFVRMRLVCVCVWCLFTWIFTAQIASKDEATRKIAVEGAKNLAVQCSDPGAVEKLVKHFFGVLNGQCSCCIIVQGCL